MALGPGQNAAGGTRSTHQSGGNFRRTTVSTSRTCIEGARRVSLHNARLVARMRAALAVCSTSIAHDGMLPSAGSALGRAIGACRLITTGPGYRSAY